MDYDELDLRLDAEMFSELMRPNLESVIKDFTQWYTKSNRPLLDNRLILHQLWDSVVWERMKTVPSDQRLTKLQSLEKTLWELERGRPLTEEEVEQVNRQNEKVLWTTIVSQMVEAQLLVRENKRQENKLAEYVGQCRDKMSEGLKAMVKEKWEEAEQIADLEEMIVGIGGIVALGALYVATILMVVGTLMESEVICIISVILMGTCMVAFIITALSAIITESVSDNKCYAAEELKQAAGALMLNA